MRGRILELRVHGVSNTPPADILGRPETDGAAEDPGRPADTAPGGSAGRGDEDQPPRLVAGDATTGFYRSARPDPTDPVTIEAYSWGQLTSGARAAKDVERGLWTLLLPFALANVALHARPKVPTDPSQERLSSRSGIGAWLIRLFCLSLTATLVLAATGVGDALIGWQCADARCLAQLPGPWEFLAEGWWSRSTRPLVIGLLLPYGLLTLVGLLTWRTYQYEADLPSSPADPADREEPDNPLRHPTFWCGEGQVRRLAAVHLVTGIAVATAVPLVAVLALDPPDGARAMLAWGAAAALLGAVLLAAGALGHPYLARRAGHAPLGGYVIVLVWLALAGVVGAIVVLLLPDGPAGSSLGRIQPPIGCPDDRYAASCSGNRSLPGFDGLLIGLASAQILLLIAIGGVCRTGRRALVGPVVGAAALLAIRCWSAGALPAVPPAPGRLATWALLFGVFAGTAAVTLLLPRRPPAGAGAGRYDRMAWGGCAPAVLAGLGWLLGSSYSAGALYWTMARLNRGDAVGRVLLPVPVAWAGPAFLIAVLALVGTAARAWVEFLLLRRRILVDLVTTGPPLSAHERRRARDVAAYHALHRLVGDRALRLVGQFTAFAGTLAALATAAALAGLRPVAVSPTGWAMLVRAAVDVGASLAGLLPVLVSALGLLVYRNDTVRRAVGVIWDIGTFWPRAAHPLAPPSYAERAVPQLQTRLTGLMALPDDDPRRADAVILSGHSQGAVIVAAVILQTPARWRRRLWFFSYGCQLSKLYGRVFPAYFGPDRLPAVATALTLPGDQPGWTNFWRPTDPLGWPVPAAARELAVRDPVALHPRGGEVRDPPIRSHGGYPQSPEYRRERAEVVALLSARATSSPLKRTGPPAPAARSEPVMDVAAMAKVEHENN